MLAGYGYMDVVAFAERIYRPQEGRIVQLVPYGYPVEFGTIDAGALSNRIVQISANADFILLNISTMDVSQALTMLIFDSATGESYSNGFVELEAYTNFLGYNSLAYPRFIPGRSSLSISIRNPSGVPESDVTMALVGCLARTASGD